MTRSTDTLVLDDIRILIVDTGSSRLITPLIKESFNNVLDMDGLPDRDTVTAQVLAAGNGFAVGDQIEMRLRGMTDDGEAVDKTYPLKQVESLSKIIHIPLPSADTRLLVNTRAVFSYRLIKADGSADRLSKRLFIRVVGEATQLAAPIALDAIAGTLDPQLPRTLIQIPWDQSMAEDQAIDLKWLGTQADQQSYFPTFDPHPITHGEGQARRPIPFSVNGEHLRIIECGTLELFYLLLRDTESREVISRQSLHADLLKIGEPVAELPAPVVEGAQDGVLDPADVPTGTRLIVRKYPGQTRGDEVHYLWNGSQTGIKTDSTRITEINKNSDIPFSIAFDLIKDNEGGTVKTSYWVKRAEGGISPSEIYTVRTALAERPRAPTVVEADTNNRIDPSVLPRGITVRVAFTGMLPGDEVTMVFEGTADGSASQTKSVGSPPAPVDYAISQATVLVNSGRTVNVFYHVRRNGQPLAKSLEYPLTVRGLEWNDFVINGWSTATFQPATGFDGAHFQRLASRAISSVTYSSSRPEVTVDANGVVRLVRAWTGAATISARDGAGRSIDYILDAPTKWYLLETLELRDVPEYYAFVQANASLGHRGLVYTDWAESHQSARQLGYLFNEWGNLLEQGWTGSGDYSVWLTGGDPGGTPGWRGGSYLNRNNVWSLNNNGQGRRSTICYRNNP
jgi:hypothetical protein